MVRLLIILRLMGCRIAIYRSMLMAVIVNTLDPTATPAKRGKHSSLESYPTLSIRTKEQIYET